MLLSCSSFTSYGKVRHRQRSLNKSGPERKVLVVLVALVLVLVAVHIHIQIYTYIYIYM